MSKLPFQSTSQQAWAFSTGQPFAKRWADETDFSSLPKRVKRIRSRRLKGCTCDEATKESLGPGITRIRGNLCNVHGKYGPCDAALSGKKKPRKGRAGAKPKKAPKVKLTPEQRTQAREQQHAANRANVAKRMADSDTGLSPSGSAALGALVKGAQPSKAVGDGLVKMGLAQQARDGSYRLTGTGHAANTAMEAGDYQRAVDAISRGTDAATGRGERVAAHGERVAAARERAQGVAQRRQDAQAKRAARQAKPAKGGGKQPATAAPAQSAPSPKRAARLSRRSGSSPASGASGATPKPKAPAKQPAPAKPTKEQNRDATLAKLTSKPNAASMAALSALQSGGDADTDQLQALADETGLVQLHANGTHTLSTEGQQFMKALDKGDVAAAQAAQARASDRLAKTHKATGGPGDYLVVEDRTKPSTWHLQVKRNGTPDHGLMGAAWAALHAGFRGNTYQGPNKSEALSKLRALYQSEGMPLPSEKEAGILMQPPSPISRETVKSAPGRILPPQHGQAAYSSSAVVPTQNQVPGKNRDLQFGQRPPDDSTVRTALSIPTSIAQFTVYKDASGSDRWLSVSSTAYRDRDQEIVSTKALSGAVALADASGYRGPLRFWHVAGADFGDCDYQATAQDGRFLIESGTFRSPALAAAVKARCSDYQISIGFTHPANEPDSAGVFHHIALFERSLVPKGRAANPFTQVALATKEQRMLTAEKQAELTKLLGGDQTLLSTLLGNIATTDKAAQEGGVSYKDTDIRAIIREELIALFSPATKEADAVTEKAAPPAGMIEGSPEEEASESPEEEAAEGDDSGGADDNMLNPAEISAIAQAVVQALGPALNIEAKMAGHLNEMKGLVGGMSAQKDASIAEVKADVAGLKAQVADLSGSAPRILAGGYRASQAQATVTTDDKKLKEAQPSADPVVQSFGAFMTDLGFGQPPTPGA